MPPEDRIAQLEAENADLREQVTALLARVQELGAQRAKGSHNSGKPPSSDGLARKTRSLRQRSGKKPGGQLGHRGETLRLVAAPDVVVEHRPAVCATCHAALGDAPVLLRERRQVAELPRLRLRVTEHQALHVRCPACQAVTAAEFPLEVPSRAQYGSRLRALYVYLVEQQLVPYGRARELLADLFGERLSLGSLVQWVRQGTATLEPVEARVKAALRRDTVSHRTVVVCRACKPRTRRGSRESFYKGMVRRRMRCGSRWMDRAMPRLLQPSGATRYDAPTRAE